MPWAVLAAGVSAAGSIGGGILGSNAAQSAAKQEAAAQQVRPIISTGTLPLARVWTMRRAQETGGWICPARW